MTASTPTGGYIEELLHTLGVGTGTAQHVQDLLLRPISVILVLVVAGLVSRFHGARLIRRGLGRYRRRLTAAGDPGQAQRIDTVGRIVADFWRVTIWLIGLFMILSLLGIDLAPLLAGATVIGATIGFGAQSLVRDFLSGLLMLLEDQYRIGDAVTVNDVSGTVEEMSLRVTRLRTPDGTAWYIPNGQILRLGNASRHWSRALVRIVIRPGASVPAALQAIEEAANEAVERPELAERCTSGPRVLGVSDVAASGISIDVEVRTVPLAADDVARALREAIVERLGADDLLPIAESS